MGLKRLAECFGVSLRVGEKDLECAALDWEHGSASRKATRIPQPADAGDSTDAALTNRAISRLDTA